MLASSHPATAAAAVLPEGRASSLRRWNIGIGSLHAIQGIAVLALATAFALPVTATFMAGPPGTPPGAPTTLFDVSIAWGVALFLFLSAGFHWLVAAPRVFERYTSGLAADHNYFRWAEYSLSSSVMIVLIAMLTGISDIAALIGIFAANAAMIFFGAVQERYESPGGSLWPFWMGCVVGIAPWLADRRLPVVARQQRPSRRRSSMRSSCRCSCSSISSRSTCGSSTVASVDGAPTCSGRGRTSC